MIMSNVIDFTARALHMNNKRGISSPLFALFLTLGAVPAWAVSPHSNWSAYRTMVVERRSLTCRLALPLFVTSVGSALRTPTQTANGPRVG
jgi:hypothetical protein